MDKYTAEYDHRVSFLKANWSTIIAVLFCTVAAAGMIWATVFAINDEKREKARIEASKFEVNGVIEGVREEHTSGLFSELVTVYIKLNGVEYMLEDTLEELEFLKTGQAIRANGQEGRIDAVIISK